MSLQVAPTRPQPGSFGEVFGSYECQKKIQHFIWRACHNALPTITNLRRRQITDSIVCELCKSHEEDRMNATWSCREIACLWNLFTWFHQVVASPPSDFTDLFSRFLQVQDDFSSEIFSITAWLIWNRRNAQHFGHLVHPGEKLIAGIRNCLGV